MSEGLQTNTKVNYGLVLGGLLFFVFFVIFFDLKPGEPQITYTAAVALLMALWWVTEAIPIGATSLLPLVLFPVFGILDGKTTAETYINYIIFLYIGGFIMALAIEKWGLHRRIALKILSLLGGSPFRILLGFMVASAFLSMWMSNTATAMMMLPIAFSVIYSLQQTYTEEKIEKYTDGLLLSIAYACSIGGVTTLVGTPPNLSFVRIYEITFPQAIEISFGNWLLFTLPLFLSLFVCCLFYLYYRFKPAPELKPLSADFFRSKYAALGKPAPEEKRVFLLFITLIFLWVFRKKITIGQLLIPGWSDLLSTPAYINDGTVAIFMALALFLLPSSKKNEALVNWEITKKIPWHIVLLFGGGFALAKGFTDSGLSSWLGNILVGDQSHSLAFLTVAFTVLMSLLTEFTSNTATTEMILPVIAGVTQELKINPLLLMLPVTLAASMAFMFPIATPPNAIIYGTGRLTIKQMAKTGIVLNIIAIILICLLTFFWSGIVFGF